MKLNAIDAAISIEDLRLPPSNRLEPLRGKRQGQWIFELMTNGGYVSYGAIVMLKK